MRAFLALIIFIAVVVVLTIVWSSQHRTQTLPLVVAASEDARNVPWRLVMPCPIDRRNVPQYRERNT